MWFYQAIPEALNPCKICVDIIGDLLLVRNTGTDLVVDAARDQNSQCLTSSPLVQAVPATRGHQSSESVGHRLKDGAIGSQLFALCLVLEV